MSVLVKTLPSKDPKLLYAYVKGAPETIKKLCIPETSKKLSHVHDLYDMYKGEEFMEHDIERTTIDNRMFHSVTLYQLYVIIANSC